MKNIILASGSRSRREMLEKINLPFTCEPQNIDETPLKNEDPRPYVKRITLSKAYQALQKHPDSCIIAADTIGYKQRKILQKPQSPEDARSTIQLLNNARHKVITGLCVMHQNRTCLKVYVTRISFKKISPSAIERFIDSEEWKNYAPCYSLLAHTTFIKSINGSFSSVMGFPMAELTNILSSFGIHHDY